MRHHPGTPLKIAVIGTLAVLGPSCDSPTQRTLTDDFRSRVDVPLFEAEAKRSDTDFRHTEYRSNRDEAYERSSADERSSAEAPRLMDSATLTRASVLRSISEQYFESVHVDSTLPIDTIIRRLDPFSGYFTQRRYEAFIRSSRDEGLWYGVLLQATPAHSEGSRPAHSEGSREGRVILTSVVQGSAAQLAGLLPGDEILTINGRALGGNDSLASAMLRSHSYVDLLLFRASANMSFQRGLSKANCDETSVPVVAMIDSQTGYVSVTGFHWGTTKKLRDAVNKLVTQGMKSLVLDLQDNPGGYLDESISAANLFVHRSGQTVTTNSRVASHITQYTLSEIADFPNLPLAILVNNGSCSASEVFTGILQDLDRAVIVGQPTIGKSLVMNFIRLPREQWLYLTVAYYMLPTGRSVQRPYTNGVLIGGEDRQFGSYDNHRHTIDSELAEGECPVYKTASGRSLYGYTGIVPDYLVVREGLYSYWFQDVASAAAANYLRLNAGWLLRTTLDSFDRFCEMPQSIVDTLLKQVRAQDSTKQKLASLQLAWMTPKILKAYVAWSIWGDYGFFKLWEQKSATVRRAVELLHSKAVTLALVTQ